VPSEAFLVRRIDRAFIPASEEDADAMSEIKVGQGIKVKYSYARNIRFHRKFMAMVRFAFSQWNPPEREYKGLPVKPALDRFRKDLLIAAGYYKTYVTLDGEVHLEAESMAFANMSESRFEKVYSDVLDVLVNGFLSNMSRDELNQHVVKELVEFV
jgi:hypothetical protein